MNQSVSDLVASTSQRLADARVRTVEDVRRAAVPLVAFSPEGAQRHEEMHRWLFARFYSHWKVARMQETAKRFLRTVFLYYLENPRTLPPEAAERIEPEGLHRAVCDFIASMTDRELHSEYRRIAMP
jgi:dGTPase